MLEWFHASSYGLCRLVIQRGLGGVYFVAFVCALQQFRPLLGERGLMPVPRFVAEVPFRESPSLFHFRYSDRLLVAVCLAGMAMSLAVVLGLPDRWPVSASVALWLALWALYLSIVNVGQRFYGFGWETLLLEAGFLAAFLGPAWCAVPGPIVVAFRWLLFRVELGAGLIKMRGDPCWRDLTCLYYHHETQPMPNSLSWWFHRLPKPLHRAEVVGSHVAQLIAPIFLFAPQPVAGAAATLMAITQAWLVLSGNFSWLNVVTLILTASALDDATLGHVLPAPGPSTIVLGHDIVVAVIATLLLALSYRPARNLFSRDQLMNASFDPLHLVNTYGAFGHVGKIRYEIEIEGTSDGSKWTAYRFKGKPGDPRRGPRQFAPYHLRLDWMMWFAALSPERHRPWLVALMAKLLAGDRPTISLLGHNPFADAPPRAVRALRYRYRFSTADERRATGDVWVRRELEELVSPFTISSSP